MLWGCVIGPAMCYNIGGIVMGSSIVITTAPYYMGGIPCVMGGPPPVSPSIGGVITQNWGVNPASKIFLKKFLENFLGNLNPLYVLKGFIVWGLDKYASKGLIIS
jgi:hypothetical protein